MKHQEVCLEPALDIIIITHIKDSWMRLSTAESTTAKM